MAEEPQSTATAEAPVATDTKVEEAVVEAKAATATEETKVEEVVVEKKEEVVAEEIASSVSFKEESNRVADLEDPEKKALEELKQLVQEALNKHEFTAPPPAADPAPAPPAESEEPAKAEAEAAAVTEEPAKVEAEAVAVTEEPPKAEAEAVAVTEEPPKAEAAAVVVTEEPPKAEAEATVEVPAAAAAAEKPVEVVVVEAPAAAAEEKTVEAIEETVVPVAAPEAPAAAVEETPAPPAAAEVEAPPPEEVSIWGVPLLGDERSDVILLKFLRARDFKVKDALAMIKSAVRWRKEFGIEELLGDADLEAAADADLQKAVFMQGVDREGHPVCYNTFGVFQDKEVYAKVFADEEKRQRFLRWRIRFLEKGIRELLDFNPGAVCTMVQVNDLKNSPGFFKREFVQVTDKAITILSDNYPEFIARQVVINVPWWYLAFNRMISPFLTQRSKSKFVYAGPSKSAETIFRYIAPEQVPVQYGGLSKENDADFSTADVVTDVTIKPGTKHTVEIPVSEV
ncbi:Patellin-3 [Acorus calamus]|uniref:Patellin-3 n=1 Tax=Acorus calamus TaxID=4465 RepID=A0AAV9EF96_ACOCL|nr:Patellin-3 [Acorus calamus]